MANELMEMHLRPLVNDLGLPHDARVAEPEIRNGQAKGKAEEMELSEHVLDYRRALLNDFPFSTYKHRTPRSTRAPPFRHTSIDAMVWLWCGNPGSGPRVLPFPYYKPPSSMLKSAAGWTVV